MADSDKEYKIKISTEADIKPVSELGKEFTALETRLSGTGQSVREFRDEMYQLDRIVPGLGDLLSTAFTGPLAPIIALTTAAGFAVKAFENMEDALEAILNEDLTGPIDRANALATAYNGIADAVAKANADFNSPEGIFSRGEKNIKAEKLSAEDAARAELALKYEEASNAQIQAENARKKAEGYKLPESDEVAKEEVNLLRQRANATRKEADQKKADAANIEDTILTSKGFGGSLEAIFTKGFWKDFGSRITGALDGSRSPFGDAGVV